MLHRRWATWRGRAVEPLVREALELAALAGTLPWPDVTAVGGWWNRQFNPEVDLVDVDPAPVANEILFAGSVKWLDTPFDTHDLTALRYAAAQVPGFAPDRSGLAVVSLSGLSCCDGIDLAWGPSDILAAWPSQP